MRLAELLPPDTKVCIVADRGLGDQKYHKTLTEELHFDYVIRFRGNIAVTVMTGGNPHRCRLGASRVDAPRVLRRAAVTADRFIQWEPWFVFSTPA